MTPGKLVNSTIVKFSFSSTSLSSTIGTLIQESAPVACPEKNESTFGRPVKSLPFVAITQMTNIIIHRFYNNYVYIYLQSHFRELCRLKEQLLFQVYHSTI